MTLKSAIRARFFLRLKRLIVICLFPIASLFSIRLLAQDKTPLPPKRITIRFLHPKTGKPLRKMPVSIAVWNEDTAQARFDAMQAGVVLQTDKKGTIVYRLPDPTPQHIGFFAQSTHLCSTDSVFAPDDVLRTGGVAAYDAKKCGETKLVLKPAPGEILVLEKPITDTEKVKKKVY
jgi:glyoxylase-like metal-dependent hydrolase (beta-lactamase superfamily II)